MLLKISIIYSPAVNPEDLSVTIRDKHGNLYLHSWHCLILEVKALCEFKHVEIVIRNAYVKIPHRLWAK